MPVLALGSEPSLCIWLCSFQGSSWAQLSNEEATPAGRVSRARGICSTQQGSGPEVRLH